MMKTLAKAIEILMRFHDAHPDLGVTEIAQQTGIDKVIVHRMLRTWAAHDFVVQDPTTRRYRLGNALFALADAYQNNFPPLEAVRPHLIKLWKDTAETINFNVASQRDMVVIQVYESPQRDRVSSKVGLAVPMYCTASGKLWLAHMDDAALQDYLAATQGRAALTQKTLTDDAALLAEIEHIRTAGYAIDRAEYDEHIHAIAAPIINQSGKLLACVSILAPAARLSHEHMPEATQRLQATASAIAHELAHTKTIY